MLYEISREYHIEQAVEMEVLCARFLIVWVSRIVSEHQVDTVYFLRASLQKRVRPFRITCLYALAQKSHIKHPISALDVLLKQLLLIFIYHASSFNIFG